MKFAVGDAKEGPAVCAAGQSINQSINQSISLLTWPKQCNIQLL